MHFLLVGMSTTLAISEVRALPPIEARPTRGGSWLGTLSRSQAKRMVGAMTAGSIQRVAYYRATAVDCHRPHHLKFARSGLKADMPDSRPGSSACQTSISDCLPESTTKA